MPATGTALVREPTPRTPAIPNLLILEEERTIREGSCEAAHAVGFNVFVAECAEDAYRILEAQSIQVVLLDPKLPGPGGLDVLDYLTARRPEAMVVLVAPDTVTESAVESLKPGPFACLTRPFSTEELKSLLRRAREEWTRAAEDKPPAKEKVPSSQGFGTLVGRSPEMEKLYRIIDKAAQGTHPVLILGESGTGRELMARMIHSSGPCKDRPFIPVDCGSVPATSLESELFGYVKGAFPGARRSKDGLLVIAEGGTIYLDGVGELTLDLQGKLLRAIQEHEIRPLGSPKHVPINVRILAASERDLEGAVAEGRVRRDLYYRLNTLTLRMPPLRDRKADIPLLAQHILERLNRSRHTPWTLGEETLKAMLAYDWPGNVRELESCLQRACATSLGPVLQIADLPMPVQQLNSQGPRAVPRPPHVVPLAELEKQAILNTIKQLNGDKLLAARLLGIGKTTLYRKLKQYGCD